MWRGSDGDEEQVSEGDVWVRNIVYDKYDQSCSYDGMNVGASSMNPDPRQRVKRLRWLVAERPTHEVVDGGLVAGNTTYEAVVMVVVLQAAE